MLKSVLIAAAVGAGIMWAYEQATAPPTTCTTCSTPYDGLLPGAIVGASVQIVLRLTEVS